MDSHLLTDGRHTFVSSFEIERVINDSLRVILEREFRPYVLLPSCSIVTVANDSGAHLLHSVSDSQLCSIVFFMMLAIFFICAVGFAGNIFTIVTFGTSAHSSFAMHVRCLAVTDMCNLLILMLDALVHYCESCGTKMCLPVAMAVSYGHVTVWYLSNVFMTSRHYQTFYFAIDRYLAVSRPLNHRVDSSVYRRISVNVTVIYVLSALVTAPQLLKIQTFICEDTLTIVSTITRLYYMRFYTPIITLLLQFTVPLVGSVSVTALMSLHCRRQLRLTNDSLRLGQSPTSSTVHNLCSVINRQNRHSVERMHRLNRSVVFLVVVFVVCELPVLIYFYVSVAVLNVPLRQLLVMLAFALSAVDSSANFVVYLATSKRKNSVLVKSQSKAAERMKLTQLRSSRLRNSAVYEESREQTNQVFLKGFNYPEESNCDDHVPGDLRDVAVTSLCANKDSIVSFGVVTANVD